MPGRLVAALRSWRAALRIARREARRARGRTALVLAMIALPVFGLTFVAVSYDMADLTRAERIDRRLGTADAELRWLADGPLTQDAWGEAPDIPEGVGTRERPVSAGELTDLLPAGARVGQVRWWVGFEARVGDRRETIDGRVLDLADPVLRGQGRLLAGRVPADPGEVALNRAALRRLHLRLGDRVPLADGSAAARVVGVVEFVDTLRPAAALPPAGRSPSEPQGGTSWLVGLPDGVDAGLTRRLNAHGIVVTARTPAPGTGAEGSALSAPVSAEDAGNLVLVGGLGLLEVVLLVGPAFAVGVRRRRRELALVAVAGGDDAHLRRVVLADGVVLGGVGAVAGLALGVAAAFAARPLMEEYVVGERFGAYRVFPAALVGIAAVAVLAGVLAALAPAWTAARQDVVAGLAGRRTPPPPRRRWPLVGVALAVCGAATAVTGAAGGGQTTVLAGLVLGELGLVLVAPTLVGALARVGRWLPLAPRIALRDASRNRSSTAPAISAVMAAVAGSVALGGYIASNDARSLAGYQPALPHGNALVVATSTTAQLPPTAQIAEAAAATLPGSTAARVDAPVCAPPTRSDEWCGVRVEAPPERACPYEVRRFHDEATRLRARADPRCSPLGRTEYFSGYSLPEVVDDGDALAALTGAPPEEVAAARRVLRAGGAVVTDPRYLHGGRITLVATRTPQEPAEAVTRTATVPGHVLRGGIKGERLVLSTAAAARVGLVGEQVGYLLSTVGSPTLDQQERLDAELRRIGRFDVFVERGGGPNGRSPVLLLLALGSGLITVGAAAVATGLAAAEGRADLSTLGAVGASPRMRRLLSLCQAGVIAVLGSTLGIVVGLATALVVLAATNRRYATSWPIEDPYPMVVPWATVSVLVVVPLVAMLGAGLFTRSRLAVERRLD